MIKIDRTNLKEMMDVSIWEVAQTQKQTVCETCAQQVSAPAWDDYVVVPWGKITTTHFRTSITRYMGREIKERVYRVELGMGKGKRITLEKLEAYGDIYYFFDEKKAEARAKELNDERKKNV